MNESFLLAAASACWLGILTSISPCPLATNIAAVSYIGKRVSHPRAVITAGLFYTFGRMLTYVGVSALIVASVLSIPDLSFFLQRHMNKILGPVLIVTGALLLGFVRLRLSGPGYGAGLQDRVDRWGIWGAIPLGAIFALAFCPVSAALFFGGLMPVAIDQKSQFLLPMLYGVGTALPAVLCAFVLAFGARFLGRIFDRLTQIELWARRITAVLFIVLGGYLIVTYWI